jgi:hypothetical protein
MAASSRKTPALPTASTSLDAREVVEVEAEVFKDTCLKLLDRVHNQETELAVTRHGEIVARVVPPEVQAPSALGFLRGTLVVHGDIVSTNFEAWDDVG